jgi:hypothetical protein
MRRGLRSATGAIAWTVTWPDLEETFGTLDMEVA